MKTDVTAKPPKGAGATSPLTAVLGESKRVNEAMQECAEELSSVNEDLKREVKDRGRQPGLQNAIARSEVVEDKVQAASAGLANVNRALGEEVKERHVLEHRLIMVSEQEAAARYASLHDSLTGLPNRTLFNDRLDHGLAQAKRHARTLAVMFMDLNEFKAINDEHGHEVGDAVLQAVAVRLSTHSRCDDTFSRHGGDEFLYLLTQIGSEQDALSIAEKVIRLIQEPLQIEVPGGPIDLHLDASVGISIFPKDGSTADQLIVSADRAMYRAKRKRLGFSLPPGRADLS